MGIVLAVFLVIAGGNYYFRGTNAPIKQTDSEYVATYKILHSGSISDKEILKERAEDDASKAEWVVSNKLLKDELDKRNIIVEDWTTQNSLNQIMWHTAYYEDNETVEDFVDSQYPESRGM